MHIYETLQTDDFSKILNIYKTMLFVLARNIRDVYKNSAGIQCYLGAIA